MATIENIERVLRQLEAIGENLEHSRIETTIENTKLTINKLGQKPRYNPGRTSTLSMVRSNPKLSSSAARSNQLTIRRNRPCIFCTRDHWDSECDVCPTVNEFIASTEVNRIRQTNYENKSIWHEEPNAVSHGFNAIGRANNGKRRYKGHLMVQSMVGPLIAESGDVIKLCQNNISSQNLVYHNTIMEQLQTGMIEEVSHNDEVGVIPYLPHHEVWNPNKNTT
ncbi:unnamed protein product, partial [Onchocerca ochengi]|uniref:Uncharacterized protein n=1 Tax=Onchocerca ochengi TaxID=42157 RepID=A0A182ESK8_ONCOC